MKISTDSVLLGAMATITHAGRILDIGTGTGVIALMLAQRFPVAVIDAVELDTMAAEAACQNFRNSPFAHRIFGYAKALRGFEPVERYDLIVANPPYFLQSLKSEDKRKQMARHTDMGFFEELLDRASRWLTPTGSLQLILPIPLAGRLTKLAERVFHLHVHWMCDIRSFASHAPIRRVLALGNRPYVGGTCTSDFVIYENKGVHSQAYRELLKDFFLAF